MSSTESNLSMNDVAQSVKKEHRTRFNTKFNEWFASKKQQPNIKTENKYDEILNAVEQWIEGERFKDDINTSRSYASSLKYPLWHNCKAQCDNNRCSCKKAGFQCNSRCHKSS